MRATWLWTALVLVAVAAGSYGLYLWLRPQPLPEQVLYGNGRVEGTEVRVAAEVSGRVVESRLSEGRTVARGDLLVRIDDTELRLRRARAEAEIESLRSDRERAERELQVSRHHKLTAETDLARYRELQEKGTVAPQRLEQAENAAKEAAGRVAVLEAQINSIEARVMAARRELDVLDFQLGKARVLSPIDATVIAKAVEAGEFVQPGRTLAVLVDLSQIELKVFIPERQIGKVKHDAAARVRVDAFPERLFEARVASVDQQAQFTPRDIHMPEERVRMVFGVKFAIENREGLLKPGMPADAWILWRSDATWPEQLFVPR